MVSIGDKWRASSGRPTGFDFLRIFLAFCVMLWHSVHVCYGTDEFWHWVWTGPLRPLIWFVVPSFFALSGFLVAGSLQRNDIVSFVTLRVIRIYPALAAEVVISALLIGPIFTSYSLSAYFGDPLFWSYLLNMTGWIHFYLPGVFTDLPGGAFVNLQLWAVPYELEAYIILTLFAVVGLIDRPRRFFGAVVALMAAYFVWHVAVGGPEPFTPPGRLLILSFLFGIGLFLAKDHVAFSPWLLVLGVLAYTALILISTLNLPFTTRPAVDLSSIFLAYVTIYVGHLNIAGRFIRRIADYSYGVYLYGFPIQQVVVSLMPGHRVWYVNLAISFPIALGVAALSWHFLESKIAARKKLILRFVSIRSAEALDIARRLRIQLRGRVSNGPGPEPVNKIGAE